MPGGKDDILSSSYSRANDSHSTPSRYRKVFGRPNNVGIELVIKFDTWFYWALGGKTPLSRRAAWWLIKEANQLTAAQRLFVDQLIGLCPDIGKVKDLALSLRRMITQQKAGQFEKWLTKARQSAFTEFRSFADGLKKDQRAVLEALRTPWSNGQVEG